MIVLFVVTTIYFLLTIMDGGTASPPPPPNLAGSALDAYKTLNRWGVTGGLQQKEAEIVYVTTNTCCVSVAL